MDRKPTTVFFRDDDVGRASEGLRNLMGVFIEVQVPCNYQVVPEFMDDESTRYLIEIKSAHPEIVTLNQHGLRHEQQLGGQRVWSEFAGGRPFDEQLGDIETGHHLLTQRLGDAFDPSIFTPPCHKYDEVTLRALDSLGFTILSAGVNLDPLSRAYYRFGSLLGRVSFLGKRVSYHGRSTPGPRLQEVSVCIDVDEEKDKQGQAVEKGLEVLWHEFEACRARTPYVGIMLHHEGYGPRKIEVIRRLVQRLKDDPTIRFASIGEIAGAST